MAVQCVLLELESSNARLKRRAGGKGWPRMQRQAANRCRRQKGDWYVVN
jgi:hypothetical protein